VNQILEIPIAPQGMDDVIAWHYTRNGIFSVRSAYHAVWDYRFGRNERRILGVERSEISPVWKKLWKLNIPSKIKIFGWRAMHGLIPCFGILANRHIIPNGGCPVCLVGCEDIMHTLFTCARAKLIWEKLGVQDIIDQATNIDRAGAVALEHIICTQGAWDPLGGVGLPELVLTGAWYIWWERRQLVHGEEVQTPQRSAMSIGALATNYWRARKKPIIRSVASWNCPPEGEVKVNVDAAYSFDEGRGSAGAIIRDYKGNFIAASTKNLPFVADPMMAEAYAVQEGLLLAQKFGCNRLIIQSDNMEVVDTMKEGGFSATSAAAIFYDCNIMAAGFVKVSFEHCPREANSVAHELAKDSFQSFSSCTWDDDPPSFILPLLINDVSVFDTM
jgi:ribonuclease HI